MNFVRLFKPQFAPLVESTRKRQTIRPTPTPKRMPHRGDQLSLRTWQGKPYRSKQRVLLQAVVADLQTIRVTDDEIYLNGMRLPYWKSIEFAHADGFDSLRELRAWFESNHDLPFEGIVIYW